MKKAFYTFLNKEGLKAPTTMSQQRKYSMNVRFKFWWNTNEFLTVPNRSFRFFISKYLFVSMNPIKSTFI